MQEETMKWFPLIFGLILGMSASNAPSQEISSQVRNQLVNQMVKDSHITRNCVRAEGEARVLGVDLLYLSQDKRPEYYVYGMGCAAVGASRPNAWIYLRVGDSYRNIWGG